MEPPGTCALQHDGCLCWPRARCDMVEAFRVISIATKCSTKTHKKKEVADSLDQTQTLNMPWSENLIWNWASANSRITPRQIQIPAAALCRAGLAMKCEQHLVVGKSFCHFLKSRCSMAALGGNLFSKMSSANNSSLSLRSCVCFPARSRF